MLEKNPQSNFQSRIGNRMEPRCCLGRIISYWIVAARWSRFSPAQLSDSQREDRTVNFESWRSGSREIRAYFTKRYKG